MPSAPETVDHHGMKAAFGCTGARAGRVPVQNAMPAGKLSPAREHSLRGGLMSSLDTRAAAFTSTLTKSPSSRSTTRSISSPSRDSECHTPATSSNHAACLSSSPTSTASGRWPSSVGAVGSRRPSCSGSIGEHERRLPNRGRAASDPPRSKHRECCPTLAGAARRRRTREGVCTVWRARRDAAGELRLGGDRQVEAAHHVPRRGPGPPTRGRTW